MVVFDTVLVALKAAASKAVIAALILLVGVVLARLIERLVRYALYQVRLDKALLSRGFSLPVEALIGNIVKYALYFVTFVVALNEVHITSQVVTVIAFAVIVVVVVSIALGIKDFIPNIWAGFWLYRRRFFQAGDVIEVNGVEGTVVSVDVLETQVRTRNGDTMFLPSSLLLHSQITKKKH